MKEFINYLISAPDTHIDASMKPLIKNWADPPEPIQVLEVLDKCIFSALAADAVVYALQILYDKVCENNHTTHEEVVKMATWRDKI